MENQIVFGTYNVPPITEQSLTASFTTQGALSKEMLAKIYSAETEISRENISEIKQLNTLLGNVLSAPSTAK